MIRYLHITIIFCLALCLLSHHAESAVTTEWVVGTTTTLISSELNSIGPNGYTVASGVYDNRIGQSPGFGYTMCRIEGVVSFGAAPVAPSSLTIWYLKSTDNGTTYENTPNGTIILNRNPDVVIPITTGLTTPWTTRVSVDVFCPAERMKIVVKNDGSGQTTAASGNTIKFMPISPQGN